MSTLNRVLTTACITVAALFLIAAVIAFADWAGPVLFTLIAGTIFITAIVAAIAWELTE